MLQPPSVSVPSSATVWPPATAIADAPRQTLQRLTRIGGGAGQSGAPGGGPRETRRVPATTAPSEKLSLDDKLVAARTASIALAQASTSQKNAGLEAIAQAVGTAADRILPANELDLANGRENGMTKGLQDRLRLDPDRLAGLAAATREVIALPDPVGTVLRGSTLPNGLQLTQVRVPFGVVGAIYEARPNVTIDIAALALKSGNAVVLRGGSAAENTNRVLV